MCDQQYQCDSSLERNRAERVPSLLTRLVHAVQADEAAFVFEDQRCLFEADAVLALVLAVLSWIPLEVHCLQYRRLYVQQASVESVVSPTGLKPQK